MGESARYRKSLNDIMRQSSHQLSDEFHGQTSGTENPKGSDPIDESYVVDKVENMDLLRTILQYRDSRCAYPIKPTLLPSLDSPKQTEQNKQQPEPPKQTVTKRQPEPPKQTRTKKQSETPKQAVIKKQSPPPRMSEKIEKPTNKASKSGEIIIPEKLKEQFIQHFGQFEREMQEKRLQDIQQNKSQKHIPPPQKSKEVIKPVKGRVPETSRRPVKVKPPESSRKSMITKSPESFRGPKSTLTCVTYQHPEIAPQPDKLQQVENIPRQRKVSSLERFHMPVQSEEPEQYENMQDVEELQYDEMEDTERDEYQESEEYEETEEIEVPEFQEPYEYDEFEEDYGEMEESEFMTESGDMQQSMFEKSLSECKLQGAPSRSAPPLKKIVNYKHMFSKSIQTEPEFKEDFSKIIPIIIEDQPPKRQPKPQPICTNAMQTQTNKKHLKSKTVQEKQVDTDETSSAIKTIISDSQSSDICTEISTDIVEQSSTQNEIDVNPNWSEVVPISLVPNKTKKTNKPFANVKPRIQSIFRIKGNNGNQSPSKCKPKFNEDPLYSPEPERRPVPSIIQRPSLVTIYSASESEHEISPKEKEPEKPEALNKLESPKITEPLKIESPKQRPVIKYESPIPPKPGLVEKPFKTKKQRVCTIVSDSINNYIPVTIYDHPYIPSPRPKEFSLCTIMADSINNDTPAIVCNRPSFIKIRTTKPQCSCQNATYTLLPESSILPDPKPYPLEAERRLRQSFHKLYDGIDRGMRELSAIVDEQPPNQNLEKIAALEAKLAYLKERETILGTPYKPIINTTTPSTEVNNQTKSETTTSQNEQSPETKLECATPINIQIEQPKCVPSTPINDQIEQSKMETIAIKQDETSELNNQTVIPKNEQNEQSNVQSVKPKNDQSKKPKDQTVILINEQTEKPKIETVTIKQEEIEQPKIDKEFTLVYEELETREPNTKTSSPGKGWNCEPDLEIDNGSSASSEYDCFANDTDDPKEETANEPKNLDQEVFSEMLGCIGSNTSKTDVNQLSPEEVKAMIKALDSKRKENIAEDKRLARKAAKAKPVNPIPPYNYACPNIKQPLRPDLPMSKPTIRKQ